MRLIDADALIESIKECVEAKDANCEWEHVQGLECALECIDEEPTVQPVVHGEWILCDNQRREDVANGNFLYFCNQCLRSDLHAKSVTVSYCWNCGAKMDGEGAGE